MREEAKMWWEQAKDDFEKARILAENKKYDGAAFYCQQAVETALKALYIQRYQDLIKVHDLVFLAKKLNIPVPILDYCIKLNKVYVETRYPDTSGIIPAKRFSEEEIKNYLELAGKTLKWLEQNL